MEPTPETGTDPLRTFATDIDRFYQACFTMVRTAAEAHALLDPLLLHVLETPPLVRARTVARIEERCSVPVEVVAGKLLEILEMLDGDRDRLPLIRRLAEFRDWLLESELLEGDRSDFNQVHEREQQILIGILKKTRQERLDGLQQSSSTLVQMEGTFTVTKIEPNQTVQPLGELETCPFCHQPDCPTIRGMG